MYDNVTRVEAPLHRCEECGAAGMTRETREQTFRYGDDDEAVTLRVAVPVWACAECGDEYTDGDAEDIRHAAVCRHLGRLTPVEVKSARADDTQETFAKRIGVGVASIKRWESGNQIQSASSDKLLRLAQRCPDILASLETVSAPPTKKFRTNISDEVRERAAAFHLQPKQALMVA